MKGKREIRLKGVPVGKGIAIGSLFFWREPQEEVPEFPISLGEVDQEISRYRSALFSSRRELTYLQDALSEDHSSEAAKIIHTHIQMLEDPLITVEMEGKIREMHRNTESVFHSVMKEYELRFAKVNNAFFREKLVDVQDLSKRILHHLCSKDREEKEIPYKSILIADELSPSLAAALDPSRVVAFITRFGGGNSHVALIARAKGIPFLSEVNIDVLLEWEGESAVVDGCKGDLVVFPFQETVEKYQEQKKQLSSKEKTIEKGSKLLAQTLDGSLVHLFANIGGMSDLDDLSKQEVEGVGLLRTEYLFLQGENSIAVPEEVQYRTYVQILEKMKGSPVTLRFFDFGGDKFPTLFPGREKEENPLLGIRGIRFLLQNQLLFKTQIRAAIRASIYGPLKLLLPMVCDVKELVIARELIEEVRKELEEQLGCCFPSLPLGCMIEVPSAVMICDILLKKCDFLSIGSNDLFQYTLGIDRNHAGARDLYFTAHLSLLRMIKILAIEAKKQNVPITLCGELAADPFFIPLLLGLGIEAFSCPPLHIPAVKRIIRQCSLLETYKISQKVLTLEDSSDIFDLLMKEYQGLSEDALKF